MTVGAPPTCSPAPGLGPWGAQTRTSRGAAETGDSAGPSDSDLILDLEGPSESLGHIHPGSALPGNYGHLCWVAAITFAKKLVSQTALDLLNWAGLEAPVPLLTALFSHLYDAYDAASEPYTHLLPLPISSGLDLGPLRPLEMTWPKLFPVRITKPDPNPGSRHSAGAPGNFPFSSQW